MNKKIAFGDHVLAILSSSELSVFLRVRKIVLFFSLFYFLGGEYQLFAETFTTNVVENSAEISQETHEAHKTNFDDSVVELRSLRNPFISQLPSPGGIENTSPEPPPRLEPDLPPVDISTQGITENVTPVLPINPIENEPPPEIIPPNFTVLGLVWNTEKPQAIINNSQGDKIISVGDSIDAWEVLLINQSGIEIGIDGKTFFVSSGFGGNETFQN